MTGQHFILIGYRATGKTTLARILAEKLNIPAIDSDDIIEQTSNLSIAQIFEQHGEDYFRDLEAKVVADLLQSEKPIVLATGGGVPIRPANRELLKRSGFVVWLQASPETIHRRMTFDPTTETKRPGLTDLPPAEEIVKLLEKRHPYYRETAHLEIDTEKMSLEELAERIHHEYQKSRR